MAARPLSMDGRLIPCRDEAVSDKAHNQKSAQWWLDLTTMNNIPRQEQGDAIEVLSCPKSQGFKIGLISNCSPDTPLIWRDTPFVPFFDTVVFSRCVKNE